MKKIMLSLMLLLSVLSFKIDAATKQPDNERIVVTANQPVFTLKLESNPTTGYRWFLKNYDHRLLSPIKHVYQAGKTGLIGAPGREVWTFKAKPRAFHQSQQSIIKMIYARPWRGGGIGQEKLFLIHFRR